MRKRLDAPVLRMAISDRHSRADYARAIEVYEALAAKTPKAIYYRTGLIATLREYASVAEKLDDQVTALASWRRACDIADGLLADPDAKLPCFRKQLVPEARRTRRASLRPPKRHRPR